MKHEVSAKRLADLLAEYNMKSQDLVERTGISKASVSLYLSGKVVPSNIYAGKMAEVFHVSPAWIMGFDVPKEPTDSFRVLFDRLDQDDQEAIIGRMMVLLESDKYKKSIGGKGM